MKTLTVKLIKYRMRGVTKLIDWYGQEGFIEMKPVDFDTLPEKEKLFEYLNDNGFGCQKIVGGWVDIYEVYEGNLEKLSELNNITVGDVQKNEMPEIN